MTNPTIATHAAPAASRCDKEIGRPGHWHQCRAKARVRYVRLGVAGVYFMDYCDKHA